MWGEAVAEKIRGFSGGMGGDGETVHWGGRQGKHNKGEQKKATIKGKRRKGRRGTTCNIEGGSAN